MKKTEYIVIACKGWELSCIGKAETREAARTIMHKEFCDTLSELGEDTCETGVYPDTEIISCEMEYVFGVLEISADA